MKESITPTDVTNLARAWAAQAHNECQEANDAATLERLHYHTLHTDHIIQHTVDMLTSLLDFAPEQAYAYINAVWNQIDATKLTMAVQS